MCPGLSSLSPAVCLLDAEEAKNTAVRRQRHIFRAVLTFRILLLSSPCDTRRNIPGDTRWPRAPGPRASGSTRAGSAAVGRSANPADISHCDINQGRLEQGREFPRRWGEARTSLRRGTPRSVRPCPACSVSTPAPKRCSAPWQQPPGCPTRCHVGEQPCSSLAVLGHPCSQRLPKDTHGPGVGNSILTGRIFR